MDVLVGDGDKLEVCNKNEVNLDGLVQLPAGWTKTVVILK